MRNSGVRSGGGGSGAGQAASVAVHEPAAVDYVQPGVSAPPLRMPWIRTHGKSEPVFDVVDYLPPPERSSSSSSTSASTVTRGSGKGSEITSRARGGDSHIQTPDDLCEHLMMEHVAGFVLKYGEAAEIRLRMAPESLKKLPFLELEHPKRKYYEWLKATKATVEERAPHLLPKAWNLWRKVQPSESVINVYKRGDDRELHASGSTLSPRHVDHGVRRGSVMPQRIAHKLHPGRSPPPDGDVDLGSGLSKPVDTAAEGSAASSARKRRRVSAAGDAELPSKHESDPARTRSTASENVDPHQDSAEDLFGDISDDEEDWQAAQLICGCELKSNIDEAIQDIGHGLLKKDVAFAEKCLRIRDDSFPFLVRAATSTGPGTRARRGANRSNFDRTEPLAVASSAESSAPTVDPPERVYFLHVVNTVLRKLRSPSFTTRPVPPDTKNEDDTSTDQTLSPLAQIFFAKVGRALADDESARLEEAQREEEEERKRARRERAAALLAQVRRQPQVEIASVGGASTSVEKTEAEEASACSSDGDAAFKLFLAEIEEQNGEQEQDRGETASANRDFVEEGSVAAGEGDEGIVVSENLLLVSDNLVDDADDGEACADLSPVELIMPRTPNDAGSNSDEFEYPEAEAAGTSGVTGGAVDGAPGPRTDAAPPAVPPFFSFDEEGADELAGLVEVEGVEGVVLRKSPKFSPLRVGATSPTSPPESGRRNLLPTTTESPLVDGDAQREHSGTVAAGEVANPFTLSTAAVEDVDAVSPVSANEEDLGSDRGRTGNKGSRKQEGASVEPVGIEVPPVVLAAATGSEDVSSAQPPSSILASKATRKRDAGAGEAVEFDYSSGSENDDADDFLAKLESDFLRDKANEKQAGKSE